MRLKTLLPGERVSLHVTGASEAGIQATSPNTVCGKAVRRLIGFGHTLGVFNLWSGVGKDFSVGVLGGLPWVGWFFTPQDMMYYGVAASLLARVFRGSVGGLTFCWFFETTGNRFALGNCSRAWTVLLEVSRGGRGTRGRVPTRVPYPGQNYQQPGHIQGVKPCEMYEKKKRGSNFHD